MSRLLSSSGRRCQRRRCFVECPLGSQRSAGGHPDSGERASSECQLDAPSFHLVETLLMPILEMGKLRAREWNHLHEHHLGALQTLFRETSVCHASLLYHCWEDYSYRHVLGFP